MFGISEPSTVSQLSHVTTTEIGWMDRYKYDTDASASAEMGKISGEKTEVGSIYQPYIIGDTLPTSTSVPRQKSLVATLRAASPGWNWPRWRRDRSCRFVSRRDRVWRRSSIKRASILGWETPRNLTSWYQKMVPYFKVRSPPFPKHHHFRYPAVSFPGCTLFLPQSWKWKMAVLER